MKKVRVEEEGKTFEALVNLLLIQPRQTPNEPKRLLGMMISGSLTACRAIHASVYINPEIIVIDEEKGTEERYRSTNAYRRVEEMNGKVCHSFLLPRQAITEEYQQELMAAQKDQKPIPDRILLAPKGNIVEKAGQFIALSYGLPRSADWANQYLSLLPEEKWYEIEVVATELAGEWKHLRAVYLRSMEEQDVLDLISPAIQDDRLNVLTSIGRSAVFREGMKTEEYLRENAEVLAEHLDQHMKPQYDGSHYVRYLGEMERLCIPAQARVVMGALTVLKKKKSAFLVGDMGTGSAGRSAITAV